MIPILRRNGVEFAGIFGSYARGEAKGDSDVDVLVRFSIPKSLTEVIGLERELSSAVRIKVEIITQKSLHPYIAKNALNDLKVIYGER